VIALTGVRLVDGTGRAPLDRATIVIDGDTIAAVGDAPPPEGATVLQLDGATVLPGLIDVHVHLSSLGPSVPTHLRPFGLARAARAMLDGGITTIRDLGSYGRSLFDLRDAIDLGLVTGPRVMLCGQIVAATSPGAAAFPGMYREADGPDDMRRAVREQVRQGADVIKFMATGAITVPDEDIGPAQLTRDEVTAIVDEAHRLGKPVAAHAEGSAGIRLAVEAGADTIEHGEMGYEVPDVLDAMAERGIVLVPTLMLFDAVADDDSLFPPWMRERARHLRDAARRTVEAAQAAGVELAMGADAGPHGENARELVAMVAAGISPETAIAAATSTAARVCGLADTHGAVEAGKAADLLVVDGDPLEDIGVLADRSRVRLVLKGGVPVSGSARAFVEGSVAGLQEHARD
jgi:imidazolonepropionase-like amidohydrolase